MINYINFVCPQFVSIENKKQLCYKKINPKQERKNKKQKKKEEKKQNNKKNNNINNKN